MALAVQDPPRLTFAEHNSATRPAQMARALLTASLLLGAAAVPRTLIDARNRHLARLRDAQRVAHLRQVALGTASPTVPADQFYNQTLDHFNPLNYGWWQQRFWCVSPFPRRC